MDNELWELVLTSLMEIVDVLKEKLGANNK